MHACSAIYTIGVLESRIWGFYLLNAPGGLGCEWSEQEKEGHLNTNREIEIERERERKGGGERAPSYASMYIDRGRDRQTTRLTNTYRDSGEGHTRKTYSLSQVEVLKRMEKPGRMLT